MARKKTTVHPGYTLRINGVLAPEWFNSNRKVLREEAHVLLPPHGDAKIEPVNVRITKRRSK